MPATPAVVALLLVLIAAATARSDGQVAWQQGEPRARLVPPTLNGPMAGIVERTLNGYLGEQYGWTLPVAARAEEPGVYIVAGNESSNPVLAELAKQGVELKVAELGGEGFRVLTRERGERRFVIVAARTPVGLKHGCQELVFFRLPATAEQATVDWPMDVTRKPQFRYRGIYMLPCWAQHDSVESWKRVLRFNSEITVNRNWFWLAGFPLLAGYAGEYAGTDLAKVENVRALVALCREEGMRFYIGGGWFTWHHAKIAGGSLDRGVQWYLDMVKLLPEAEGIFLEPAGEGSEAAEAEWRQRTDAFRRMATTIWRTRPEFEFAIAIGKFNAKGYREAMHAIDQKRIYWWWCWGDPIREKALDEHPLILRWHTIVRMSDYHGSTAPPEPREAALTGFGTSYDPGQGFGNKWNGWGGGIGTGLDRPREFHPHTLPYFAHQYEFRERAWDPHLTREAFAARLARRLFDADMPAEAVGHYLELCELCPTPGRATDEVIAPIDAFLKAHADRGTPRNRDTLSRMRQAVEGLRRTRRAGK